MAATVTRPRDEDDDDALPEPPPLEGDDAPLGDDAGAVVLDEGEATLDDAAAADLVLDVEFDEGGVGLDVPEVPLDVGADEDELVIDESEGALDDRAFDDGSIPNDLEVPDLADDRGDRGDEGPLGETLELGALPPLDDDDEDHPSTPPVPTSPVATLTRLEVEGVVDAAFDGRRLALLAGDVFAIGVSPFRPDDIARVEVPDATGCALAVDPRGAVYVATIEGVTLRRGPRGAWRRMNGADVAVRAVVWDGARVWARTRGGALLRGDAGATWSEVPEPSRAGTWSSDGAGTLAVVDAASRGALCVSVDGGAWRRVSLPEGVTPTRVAVRGEAFALIDGVRRAVWGSLDGGARWSRVALDGAVAIALVETDDGRVSLLVATRDGAAPRVTVWRIDGDGALGAPVSLATARVTGDDVSDAVSLVAIGRGGILGALVVGGSAYVVEAGGGGTRLRS